MKVLVLALCLALTVAATATEIEGSSKPAAGGVAPNLAAVASRWGIPSFEDEACVLCQYVVQRVENRLVQHLDALDNGKVSASLVPSSSDPFAAPVPPQPAVPGTAASPADVIGTTSPISPPTPRAMSDLSFEPSLEFKKSLIRSLRSRWGGSSILRRIWSDFLVDFCGQDKLPELYVPVCSMMYESARKMMKLIYYGFPNDQVCLMAKMCGRNSYFTTPTAVHDPVMSLYWNNKRGLSGFEGGVDGITKEELMKLHGMKAPPKPAAGGGAAPTPAPAPAPAPAPKPVDPTKVMVDHLKNKVQAKVQNVANKAKAWFRRL